MGAINYFTSDYITLGIKLYDIDDFKSDKEFMQEMEEETKEYGGTLDDNIYSYIDECYECDRENVETILNKYDFTYYHIAIKPGYYEGFTLDIENNYGIYFDSYTDRRESMKELTQLQKMLIDCAGVGLVTCFPGWCTGYASGYIETVKDIKKAIKEMRQEVKTTPTYNQYFAK